MADLFGMNIGLPSFQTIAIIFVIFLTFMFIMLMVIIFVIRKRKVDVSLYMARAGESSYRKLKMKAKKVFDGGIVYLKLWRLGVIDKKIPIVESDYFYPDKRGKDELNLMVDSKGFIHKLKLPNLSDMLEFMVWQNTWKEVVNHEKSINKETKEKMKVIHERKKADFLANNKHYDVYLASHPHETMEYVARQTQKGKEKYAGSFMEKWGHIAMPIAAMVISMIMILFAMIFSQKILG